MLDLHTHVIPAVDDGAATLASACKALLESASQGVDTIIATPHIAGGLTLNPEKLARRLADIDTAWNALLAIARTTVPELRLSRGAEVMLDSPRLDFSDPRLRIGGGRCVLVEFAGFTIPPGSDRVLNSIVAMGYVPVLAHPERYESGDIDVSLVRAWRAAGAVLQLNAGSLLGQYGGRTCSAAVTLLELGLVDLIASDYHARGAPSILGCRGYLVERGGSDQVELLMEINPRRIAEGILPLPVPPLERIKRKRLWFARG